MDEGSEPMNGHEEATVGGRADAVERAAHGVVRVKGRRRMAASGVVWSDDGLIVTAHHVVERDEGIRVGLHDGGEMEAAVVGRDPSTDLAVLRVAETGLVPAAWADHHALRVGDAVVALARPRVGPEATLGIVSALGPAWRTGMGGIVDPYLRTDVVMYPGFSGGALLDATGRVLGIVSSALWPGASVAVPTETVRRVADALLAHGRIRRGYLGVTAQPVRVPEALEGAAGARRGLLVAGVEPGSPAAEAGVLLGDVLLVLDGEPLRSVDDLLVLLGGDRVGRAMPLSFLRGGTAHEVTVTIGDRPR